MESLKIKKFIKDNIIAVVYFSNNSCGACEAIKGKVEEILSNFKECKLWDVNIDENQKLVGEYSIFSAPLGIVYVEGREVLRFGRNIDLLALERDLNRYIDILNE